MKVPPPFLAAQRGRLTREWKPPARHNADRTNWARLPQCGRLESDQALRREIAFQFESKYPKSRRFKIFQFIGYVSCLGTVLMVKGDIDLVLQ